MLLPLPPLVYTTSWVGNSFGGRGGKHVQLAVDAMAVSSDGTVFTNSAWDEGGREAGVYREGDVLANPGHTHGWGYGGGSAVAVDERYLYLAQSVDSEGGRPRLRGGVPRRDGPRPAAGGRAGGGHAASRPGGGVAERLGGLSRRDPGGAPPGRRVPRLRGGGRAGEGPGLPLATEALGRRVQNPSFRTTLIGR